MNTNRMERYLLKSAGEDERGGGGLGLAGNVAAAGIAGGAGYMGYQKFKPELHQAYHEIMGKTRPSAFVKGLAHHTRLGSMFDTGMKGLKGAGLVGAGVILHKALGHAEGFGAGLKDAMNLPKSIKQTKENWATAKALKDQAGKKV
jgi:hypothetical protein